MNGCMTAGGVGALVLLLLGVAVPLAGGTDFGGAPRVLGTALVIGVWAMALVSAGRARQWGWLAAVLVLGPLPLVIYGTSVSNDFSYPEQWSAFARAPWYLAALLLTPLPVLAYGVFRLRAGN